LNKSQVLNLGSEPLTKVLVANPNIADVQVVTPSQLMLVGKANGMTSLVLLGAQRVVTVDLIVQPGPVMPTRVPDGKTEPHSVLVQRADKMSESVFVRDQDGNWVELGSARIEGEAGKK
jgi:Flp pilus assembly secretin CpaC